MLNPFTEIAHGAVVEVGERYERELKWGNETAIFHLSLIAVTDLVSWAKGIRLL